MGTERRSRDLIQKGLKQVMILFVDDDHLDRRPLQHSRRRQAAETPAHDDDSR